MFPRAPGSERDALDRYLLALTWPEPPDDPSPDTPRDELAQIRR